MSDSAKGPLAGYLFQFEKALLLLASLDSSNELITIEGADDISAYDESNVLIITVQAKHSISPSGTTFEDTSYSLWRTLEIWIQKLQKNIFSDQTDFICATNKKIPVTSLLFKIKNLPLKEVINTFKDLLKEQELKLKTLRNKDPNSGKSISLTIKLIKFVLKNSKEFEIIKNHIKIDDEENLKEKFITKIHMMSDLVTPTQRDNVYDIFYGWIVNNSVFRWRNSTEAIFMKKDFDDKMALIHSNPSIVNAIFRTKQSLGSISEDDIFKRKKELFVKQIEDINRRHEAKERKIKDAILDFIYSDIEISYIITMGNYTKEDFDAFLEECYERWQQCYDSNVIMEIQKYNDEDKNALAIKIYDTVMDEIDIKFKDDFSFTTGNKYIRNGSLLRLSNIPRIGWHPEWETKYIAVHEAN